MFKQMFIAFSALSLACTGSALTTIKSIDNKSGTTFNVMVNGQPIVISARTKRDFPAPIAAEEGLTLQSQTQNKPSLTIKTPDIEKKQSQYAPHIGRMPYMTVQENNGPVISYASIPTHPVVLTIGDANAGSFAYTILVD